MNARLVDDAQTLARGRQLLGLRPFSRLVGAELQHLGARAEAVCRSQAVCRCEVFALRDGQEKLCAVAQGAIAVLPPSTTLAEPQP